MTVVEFYDKRNQIDNIVSSLLYNPDKVILIGNNRKVMEKSADIYGEITQAQGKNIDYTIMSMDRNRLDKVIDVLEEIIQTEEDLVFDIEGGEEVFLTALGILYERHKQDKEFGVHRYVLGSRTIYNYRDTSVTRNPDYPFLSVKDNIRIYGGTVVSTSFDEFGWELDPELIDDIKSMWRICKNNPTHWNRQMNMLSCIENNMPDSSTDNLYMSYCVDDAKLMCKQHKMEYFYSGRIMNSLSDAGLIMLIKDEPEEKVLYYKNEKVRTIMAHAGQLLELYVTAVMKSAIDDEGYFIYDDVETGVSINWEGMQYPIDVNNEVDVIAMHGLVPIFISCKNGSLTVEELYKFYTVAEHFGGEYAKKILIAPTLDEMGSKGEGIRARALKMNIMVIDDLDNKSEEYAEEKLAKLFTN